MTYSGNRKQSNKEQVERKWESLSRDRCYGRFVPATEKEQLRRRLCHESLDQLSYMEWLRTTTTLSVDTEVNLQLSEFTLKKHKMKRIESSIEKHPDFEKIFGVQSAISGMQSAEVRNTKHRTWLRLVGRRHDVMLWTKDTRTHNVFPHNDLLDVYESSDDAVFESFRRRRFPAVDKWFVRKDQSKNHNTYLGLFMPHARRIMEIESVDPKKMTTSQKSELHNLKQKAKSTPPQLKEIVVYDDATVHVFNITEWGRRYFRTIVYTNSSALCLHDFSAKLIYRGKAARPCLVGGDPRRYWAGRSSLLVLRNLNLEIGPQLYIPERLLRGIVPCALLQKYIFWRSEVSGKLIGYLREQSKIERPTLIEIDTESRGYVDTSNQALSVGVARIRRFTLLESSMKAVYRGGYVGNVDPSVEPLTLVNLLDVSPTLRSVRNVLTRMENLSHIFVWAAANDGGISSIELPRIGLSFTMKQSRLYVVFEREAREF